MRRSKRAMKRQSTQTTTIETTTTAASTTSATTGCAKESHSINGTAPSPRSERAMFENGSGEVLAEARVVSLAAWLVAAGVPPMSEPAGTVLAWGAPKMDPARDDEGGVLYDVW